MACGFMTDDFLLQSEAARTLYHKHASKMPIFDYHCHIVPADIAEDKRYENLSQVWLYGDHYKWRAMRSNGVGERYCTGDASDWEKFAKWAETVPYTMGNPLYHWTHLELKNVFGIEGILLGPDTAREIYDQCSEMLREPEFSCRGLMRQANVRAICTTDDPTDTLEHHAKIKADGFEIKVLPTWRPDKGMATEDVRALNAWIDKLGQCVNVDVVDFGSYLEAMKVRHEFFHEMGCRLSDHGLETAYAQEYTAEEIEAIFGKLRGGTEVSEIESLKFKSAMMHEFGVMDHAAGWTQQVHFGPIRSNSTRIARLIGPDTGFDSIGDLAIAKPLARYLDGLDVVEKLPRTILYNINPAHNAVMATMIGNFQDGSTPGKMQFGSGWWFLDQKDGMERQLTDLSSLGLLSRFVGMLTDSRSFLSYPRHEYFRRILCNFVGGQIDRGELPAEMGLIGGMIENICFNNAVDYFGIDID